MPRKHICVVTNLFGRVSKVNKSKTIETELDSLLTFVDPLATFPVEPSKEMLGKMSNSNLNPTTVGKAQTSQETVSSMGTPNHGGKT